MSLRATASQLDARDEVVVTREELLSSNEDLQSLNEELTAAQEELQTANEELHATNRELARQSREVARANTDLVNVLATVDIPILILDSQRRIRRFTPNARRILNVIDSDLGRPFTDIRPNLDVPGLAYDVDAVIESGIGTESEVRDLSGRWHRLQIHPYKTTEDINDGAIISLIDIDGLKDLVRRTELANQHAEQANRTKDEFLATLSHELRSPLHGMLAHAQLLRRAGTSEPHVLKASENIEAGVLLLSRLIDDLLDVSRILSGKMPIHRRTVDLSTIVYRAIESVADKCARCSLRVSVQLPAASEAVYVTGDAVRLEQVVMNLLSNAIKFTPDHGSIEISLERCGSRAALTVRDTGVGIDPLLLPLIFDRFTQANNGLAREFGGLGLGLAIVRHFVDVHDGEVSAESEGPGKGSTFRVLLPALELRAGHPQERVERATTPVLADVRILVVDDDRAARQAIEQMLQQAGAQVWGAASTADALDAIPEFSPQLMLCDIAMPGEDGLSLIRRVRALEDQERASIPALALTALAHGEDRERILLAGYQRHLAKPVDIDVLTQALVDLQQAPLVQPGL